MAIYVYNLQFSVANPANGMFIPYNSGSQSGLGVSSMWLEYNGSGTPPTVYDYPAVLPPLIASQWQMVPTSQQNPLTLNSAPSGGNPTDYILVRVFPVESLTNPQVRMTAVLGRGTNGPVSTPNFAQSPFLMGLNARPVIDFDNAAATPNWVRPGTDGAWTFCLGGVHGNANDYSCNVGATVYVPAPQSYQGTYAFGHDPQLHVVMPGKKIVAA
jgi:hypothetical protein